MYVQQAKNSFKTVLTQALSLNVANNTPSNALTQIKGHITRGCVNQ